MGSVLRWTLLSRMAGIIEWRPIFVRCCCLPLLWVPRYLVECLSSLHWGQNSFPMTSTAALLWHLNPRARIYCWWFRSYSSGINLQAYVVSLKWTASHPYDILEGPINKKIYAYSVLNPSILACKSGFSISIIIFSVCIQDQTLCGFNIN